MITEKEYLKSMQNVIDYRNQIIQQVASVDILKKSTREIVKERFLIDENFNRVHLAKELGVSRECIQRHLRKMKL